MDERIIPFLLELKKVKEKVLRGTATEIEIKNLEKKFKQIIATKYADQFI